MCACQFSLGMCMNIFAIRPQTKRTVERTVWPVFLVLAIVLRVALYSVHLLAFQNVKQKRPIKTKMSLNNFIVTSPGACLANCCMVILW